MNHANQKTGENITRQATYSHMMICENSSMCPEHGKEARKYESEKRYLMPSLKTRLPFPASFAIHRIHPIFPHIIMPPDSIKAILSQPRAMIIASRLHYSLFFTEIDNIK
jgi:hypothetical protein